ncbi:hypothetical protein NUW58_g156 [Xylaria curta]|uniref:Uncharacterized protein n=1 Tax=Xylaria curta TaxID=42375 RepID=A0ACC1PST2_9PEZI|nr:hypothetical protein NUW58_g156 [Xylaria curta]
MDDALNVASTVTGVLSLAIQLVHLTHTYTSKMINLPRSVASYLADLTLLKQLLSDIQNGLALPFTTSGIGAASHLVDELRIIQSDLETLQDRLHNAQNHEVLFAARNVLWPFSDDETARWAKNLRMCRDRIESTIIISNLSLVVEHLLNSKKVAYYYCDYQSSANKNITMEIAAAILRQLLDTKIDIPAAVRDMYQALGNGRSKLKLDDITSLIHRLSLSESSFFIVVDAIDECGSYRKPVLQLLRKLSKGSSNVLISGRSHVTEIGRIFDSYSQLKIKAPTSDIVSFTEEMIASSELSELIPDNLKADTVRHVADQACGIFLIAVLKCIHLTHLSRFSEIRNAVQAHSNGLADLYKESMERIMHQPNEKRKTATKALSWIYHSKRQLSVGELVHALAIDCDEAVPTYEDVISEQTVLDVCAGLVVIENKTVRFVHHTLQEYFEAAYETWFCGERRFITKACLIYLRLASPTWSLVNSVSLYPFLKYAAEHWGAHARDEYHSELDGVALALFRDIPALEKISSLIGGEQEEKETMLMFPCQNLAVQMSARFGALQVLKMLLRNQHHSESADPSGRTALHWAARGGFVDIVRILLDEGVEPNPRTKNGMTPFQWAAKHGHVGVINELIPHTNPTEATPDGRTALHWASSQGHISVVKTLLSDSRIDARCRSSNGWTPLHWAACSGKRAVVIYGVKGGEDTAGPPIIPREASPLSGGESSGHEEVTELLLEFGADQIWAIKKTRLHYIGLPYPETSGS